jgi:phenylpropionate dioxygenase-like ring-hydroxylating dioxygenase large terminal subunit
LNSTFEATAMELLVHPPRLPLPAHEHLAGGLADHRTPLIRNCWYVAALASELTRTPFARRLLGTDVVFYRTEAGDPVALRNRCPHRSFPLSKGRLDGDVLVCGYHGMAFEPGGRCVNLPSLAQAPAGARVRSYELMERGPLVWIWMGEPDRADPDQIPDTGWLASPQWRTVQGCFDFKTDYVSMHENLLDQTHFPFLHPGAVGTPEYARSRLSVRREGEAVVIDRMLKNSPPPGIYAMPTGLTGKPVDRYSEARFQSPAVHTAFARIVDTCPAEGARAEFRFNITHCFTPQSQGAIHYWWFCSRDFDLGDVAKDDFLREASAKAYLEDVDALEAILELVRNDAEPFSELHFAPDKPGLLMRRALFDRAMAEADRTGPSVCETRIDLCQVGINTA